VRRCRAKEPLLPDAATGHRVACHFFEALPRSANTVPVAAQLDSRFAVRLAAFERAVQAREVQAQGA
jgi:oligopeptide transport system ATP-binding protein